MTIDNDLKKVPVARCGILEETCSFCSNRAVIDAPTHRGPFAYFCIDHIKKHSRSDWQTSGRRIGPLGQDPKVTDKTTITEKDLLFADRYSRKRKIGDDQ